MQTWSELTNRNIYVKSVSQARELGLSYIDHGLIIGPLFHIAAFDVTLTTATYAGGSVHILPKFDARQTLSLIMAGRISHVWLAPVMMRRVLDVAEELAVVCGQSPRLIIGGGEPTPPDLNERIFAVFPNSWYANVYGLTETSTGDTILPAAQARIRPASVGLPVAEAEVRIVDTQGRPCPPGATGQVAIGGEKLSPGYWDDPAATAASRLGPLFLTGDSITGALHAIGPRELPLPPLSLVGNYGGGSMFLIAGVLAALLRRERTGLGDVLDVATVDGTCSLLQPILELHGQGAWSDTRADNLLDGGAPFYRTYECSDGKRMAVGAIEPQFFAALLAGLGLDEIALPGQYEKKEWDVLAAAIAGVFKRHPREHRARVFQDVDACVSPVLSFGEAARHPHITERGSLRAGPGGIVAAAAPRFADAGQAGGAARSTTATLAGVLANWQRDERDLTIWRR